MSRDNRCMYNGACGFYVFVVTVWGSVEMLVCRSFLIIVWKALLILSATLIVRTGGSYLVEPLCYGVI